MQRSNKCRPTLPPYALAVSAKSPQAPGSGAHDTNNWYADQTACRPLAPGHRPTPPNMCAHRSRHDWQTWCQAWAVILRQRTACASHTTRRRMRNRVNKVTAQQPLQRINSLPKRLLNILQPTPKSLQSTSLHACSIKLFVCRRSPPQGVGPDSRAWGIWVSDAHAQGHVPHRRARAAWAAGKAAAKLSP